MFSTSRGWTWLFSLVSCMFYLAVSSCGTASSIFELSAGFQWKVLLMNFSNEPMLARCSKCNRFGCAFSVFSTFISFLWCSSVWSCACITWLCLPGKFDDLFGSCHFISGTDVACEPPRWVLKLPCRSFRPLRCLSTDIWVWPCSWPRRFAYRPAVGPLANFLTPFWLIGGMPTPPPISASLFFLLKWDVIGGCASGFNYYLFKGSVAWNDGAFVDDDCWALISKSCAFFFGCLVEPNDTVGLLFWPLYIFM